MNRFLDAPLRVAGLPQKSPKTDNLASVTSKVNAAFVLASKTFFISYQPLSKLLGPSSFSNWAQARHPREKWGLTHQHVFDRICIEINKSLSKTNTFYIVGFRGLHQFKSRNGSASRPGQKKAVGITYKPDGSSHTLASNKNSNPQRLRFFRRFSER